MTAEPPPPSPADRAVVDRVVEGTAVLLVGPDETERLVPADRLPAGAGEGTWLAVAPDADPVVVIAVDAEMTAARREGLEDRLERLRRERRGGRFARDGGRFDRG